MSDGRGPQLHSYGDRRLSAFSRQTPRLTESFEARTRLSAVAPTPGSARRRSGQPTNQIRSSFGYMGSTAGGVTPLLLRRTSGSRNLPPSNLTVQLRGDTRNSRNKVYMELLLKEVYDFCIANNFEAEMGHHISLATFETPTQKDFVFLFKFLYGKLDPNYRFLSLFDTDMKAILKSLSYPALDKLRDALSAAGEQNWHYNLAMLYWLVKLNLMLLSVNEEETFNAPTRAFEQIYNSCVFSSYASFIDKIDDYEEIDQSMEREFNNYKEEIFKAEQDKQASITALSLEKENLSEEFRRIEEAEDMTGRLKTDIASLNKYTNSLQDGFTSLNSKALEFDSIIAKLEDRISAILQDKSQFNATLQLKGVEIDQLGRLEDEQTKIAKAVESVNSRLRTAEAKIHSTEDRLALSYQQLVDSVSIYNQTIRKIPSLAGQDDIMINEEVVHNNSQQFEAEMIISRTVRAEKDVITQLDGQIKQDRLSNDEEYLQTLQLIEEHKQTLADQEDKIKLLEATLSKNKVSQEELHSKSTLEALRLDAEIEKMQKDLQAMKADMTLETLKAKTLNTNLKRELMETRYLIKDKRETLLRTVQSDLNYVINFKDHIQKTLETLRLQTHKELETEQKKADDGSNTHLVIN